MKNSCFMINDFVLNNVQSTTKLSDILIVMYSLLFSLLQLNKKTEEIKNTNFLCLIQSF